MVGQRATGLRGAIEAPHRSLNGNAGGLVEGSEDDGWQPAVDFVIDDPKWQRTSPRRATAGEAEMVERPAGSIEAHLQVATPTEWTTNQYAVSRRHVRIVRVRIPRSRVGGNAIRAAPFTDEETEGEFTAVDAFPPPKKFSRGEHVGEALCLLQGKHAEREATP